MDTFIEYCVLRNNAVQLKNINYKYFNTNDDELCYQVEDL